MTKRDQSGFIAKSPSLSSKIAREIHRPFNRALGSVRDLLALIDRRRRAAVYDLSDSLELYNAGRTGVRTDALKLSFAANLPTPLLVAAQKELAGEKPDVFLRAASHALRASGRARESSLIQIDRLEAVLRCGRDGVPLPERARSPAYEPDPSSVLYAAHMREPLLSSGYVTRTRYVLNALAEAGFRPQAVTRLGFPNDLAAYKHEHLPPREEIGGTVFHTLADDGGGRFRRPVDGYIDAYAQRLAALATEMRAGVIHAASNHVNGLAAIHAARRLGIASVYEMRGSWEETKASRDPAYRGTPGFRLERRLEIQTASEADQVIALSRGLADFLADAGVPPARIHVVPNGVDTAALQPMPHDGALAGRLGFSGRTVIGYVGSLASYEGLDMLLRAAARLDANGRRIGVLIVGDGTERAKLEALAKDIGIAELCRFTGRLPWADAVRHYSIIDIAPFPRTSSPVTDMVTPLKPFEAMALERCVIGSTAGGIRECIEDGVTGLLFSNEDELVVTLERLIDKPALRARLVAEGRRWVEQERSLQSAAKRLQDIYRALGARN